jgi:hypothetical protein
MAIHLGRLSPGASSNQPGRRCGNAFRKHGCPRLCAVPIRFCSRRGLPCRACCQPRGALLPHPFTLALQMGLSRSALLEAIRPAMRCFRFWKAVCFLWHFPWGRPRRRLSGAVFPWSPDFPPLKAHFNRERPQRAPQAAAIQPTGKRNHALSQSDVNSRLKIKLWRAVRLSPKGYGKSNYSWVCSPDAAYAASSASKDTLT